MVQGLRFLSSVSTDFSYRCTTEDRLLSLDRSSEIRKEFMHIYTHNSILKTLQNERHDGYFHFSDASELVQQIKILYSDGVANKGCLLDHVRLQDYLCLPAQSVSVSYCCCTLYNNYCTLIQQRISPSKNTFLCVRQEECLVTSFFIPSRFVLLEKVLM